MNDRGVVVRPVVIWGTGLEAVQFTYAYKKILDIVGYIDNRGNYGLFCGKQVCNFSEISDYRKTFYIFAGSLEVYEREIRPQLWDAGLTEFENFTFYQWFEKKLVLLHGNCHMAALGDALESSSEFGAIYFIYHQKSICEYGPEENLDFNAMEHCAVFIHEDIRANNEFGYRFSDEYLVPRLKPDCRNITVPHLFGLGGAFFPQWDGNNPSDINGPLRNGIDKNGMFPHRDKVIVRLMKENYPVEEIIKLSHGRLFTQKEIWDNFEFFMNKIRIRENAWDIKILEFLLENFKKYKLFYDVDHPTEVVIDYIAKEVLNLLHIKITGNVSSHPMNTHETPVYPCVYNELEMEWDNTYIRKDAKKFRGFMDLDEYIKEYMEWCYPAYQI